MTKCSQKNTQKTVGLKTKKIATNTQSTDDGSTAIVISSSSFLKPIGDKTYGPDNVFDGDVKTGWCEDVKGVGKGEWLKVRFQKATALRSIDIWAGYHKSKKLYGKNSRPSIMLFEGFTNPPSHQLGSCSGYRTHYTPPSQPSPRPAPSSRMHRFTPIAHSAFHPKN